MHERISRATATAGARERRAGGESVSFRSKGDRARVEGVMELHLSLLGLETQSNTSL